MRVPTKGGQYHSRPSPLDDENLSKNHGPLQGSGEFTGKCGKYTFKKSDPPPEFKPPGEDAKDPEGYRNEIQCAHQLKRSSVKKEDYEATVEKFCKDGRDLKDHDSAREWKGLGDGSLLQLNGQGWGSHNPESHLYYQDQDACRYVIFLFLFQCVFHRANLRTVGLMRRFEKMIVKRHLEKSTTNVSSLPRHSVDRKSANAYSAIGDPEGTRSFVGGNYVYNCVFWTVSLV